MRSRRPRRLAKAVLVALLASASLPNQGCAATLMAISQGLTAALSIGVGVKGLLDLFSRGSLVRPPGTATGPTAPGQRTGLAGKKPPSLTGSRRVLGQTAQKNGGDRTPVRKVADRKASTRKGADLNRGG